MSVVVLMSGGLDSAVMALLAQEDGISMFPLFVDYGQLACEREWDAVCGIVRSHGLPAATRMNMSGYGETIPSGITTSGVDVVENAFLPGRNAMLLLAGASYAFSVGASTVLIGLLDERGALFPDQTRRFVDEMETAIRTALAWSIRLATPLITMSKTDVMELASSIGLKDGDTYSCHLGEEPCGYCISCRERQEAYSEE